MENDKLITSAASRLFKLGGLVSRVGISMAGNAVKNVFKSNEKKQEKRTEKLVQNAAKVVKTLGTLKGVPMKLGQMLSLHERFLPPEVANILRTLQQKAPAVSFSSILELIKIELGEKFDLIEYIEPQAYASASIGQVHLASLKDGRQTVLKVQYPGIDKVISADLKNLKGVIKLIFSMFTKADLDHVWEEVKDRLIEELDYKNEAANMKHMVNICEKNQSIVIPEVIEELSSKHVLCMTLTEGIPSEKACSDEFPQYMRNKWGQVIYQTLMQTFFLHQFIHADPNLANFAFLEDGKVIIYDFGCVKKVPPWIVHCYAKLIRAAFSKNYEEVQQVLTKMGVNKINGDPVPVEIISSYAEILTQPFRDTPPFIFGEDNIYSELIDLAGKYWDDLMEITFPKDVVFIDRTVGGHFGNLSKLKAYGAWGEILKNLVNEVMD